MTHHATCALVPSRTTVGIISTMHSVVANLLVRSASLPPERLRRVAEAMLNAGFLYERDQGAGGELWLHAELDWRTGATLDEAIARFAMGEDAWGIAL
jgi:hypothetical protein